MTMMQAINTVKELIERWHWDKAALSYASEQLKDDPEVVLLGAQMSAHLSMVSERLRSDAQLWLQVCRFGGHYYRCAHPKVQKQVSVAVCAIEQGLEHRGVHPQLMWNPGVLRTLMDRYVDMGVSVHSMLKDAHDPLRRWCIQERVLLDRVKGQQQLIQYAQQREAIHQAKIIALRAFGSTKKLSQSNRSDEKLNKGIKGRL